MSYAVLDASRASAATSRLPVHACVSTWGFSTVLLVQCSGNGLLTMGFETSTTGAAALLLIQPAPKAQPAQHNIPITVHTATAHLSDDVTQAATDATKCRSSLPPAVVRSILYNSRAHT